MIDIKSYLEPMKEIFTEQIPLSFHHSYYPVYEKLQKWITRFPQSIDNSVFTDLFLLFLASTRKYLDHRNASHLFRLILSINLMQKKLLKKATFYPNQRHLEIRRISTALRFPFASKPVLSCLIGFNIMDRYELFDEENVVLALQKHLPSVRLVKESTYHHTSPHKNLKIFYFEIEKKDGTAFSLEEKKLLENKLEEKVKNSIQRLSPAIYMGLNEEEVYKNILVLSQEIQNLRDLPQAYITLDQQTGKEIIFRVTLVHVTPFHRFSLKDCFFNTTFVSERVLTVRQLENHPIEAHIFQLHLPRDASLLRSDGSLDFYAARQKVASLITKAIGEFRDYNGGIIIKQQELLQKFKECFPEIAENDPELMETFFYAITPLEKQAVLQQTTLASLFSYFLENRQQKLKEDSSYSYKIYKESQHTFLVVQGEGSSFSKTISIFVSEQSFSSHDIAYNIVESAEGIFFNCIFLQSNGVEPFIQSLLESLHQWEEKRKKRQVLRIGVEYSFVSLDPRIGGEVVSGDILRLLFEGLTRFNKSGQVENAVAESIEISSDLKEYTFKLRPALWNDGSPISAYDFDYAWKKILSPDFKTAFASYFYPIKNAKEAKEGKLPMDKVGINVINDRVLKVELKKPTPYFLQLTAYHLYSPVHRLMDQQHPQWPYQCEKNYPCNGPFQLKINQPAQGYQLIKNPLYWEANEIALDQITLTTMNPTQGLQAIQNNEIDCVGNPFGAWHPFYKPGPDERVISFPNSSVCWCVFNTSRSPFNNKKLRQAFALAVQRAKIVEDAFMPLNSAYSPLLPYSNKETNTFFPDYNPEKAQQLFHEALKEMNMSKNDLIHLSIMFHERGIREYTANCLQQQFKECLNIDFELKSLPWNSIFNKMSTGDFHLGISHWVSWVNDPIYILNTFQSSKQETNFSKWENPEFQNLISLSENEINPFQRSSHLSQAEKLLCNEMPIIPLYYQPNQALIKKDLQLIYRTPCGPFNLARSFFREKEK